MEFIKNEPAVILVGRTNVGKSSLFNCLSDKNISIAHKTPGATRDCIARDTSILGHKIKIVDSGGLEKDDGKNPFQSLIEERVCNFILSKAQLVLMVVSAKDGLTQQDRDIAKIVRKFGKKTLLVVNKVDSEGLKLNALDFLGLGFKEQIFVSAAQKQGLQELREAIIDALELNSGNEDLNLISSLQLLSFDEEGKKESEPVNVSVIGKTNAGKSTFVNAILNDDVLMTSEVAGTTLDAVDTHLTYGGRKITLVDTAGIRRQKSVHEEIEKMAIARTLCAIDRSEVCVLMISAQDGITEQDQKIAGFIFDKKKAAIIAVNKWDEEVLDEKKQKEFLESIRFNLSFLSFAPVIFLSAKYGKKIFDVMDLAIRLSDRFKKKINTSKLNRSLEKAAESHPPPVYMGQRLKMYFINQVHNCPPTFSISCSKPEGFHFSYKRYLTNFFRQDLGLKETPIRLLFNRKNPIQRYEK